MKLQNGRIGEMEQGERGPKQRQQHGEKAEIDREMRIQKKKKAESDLNEADLERKEWTAEARQQAKQSAQLRDSWL